MYAGIAGQDSKASQTWTELDTAQPQLVQRYSYYLCNSELLQLPNLKLLVYKVCWDTFIILANLKKLIKQPRFMYSVGVRFNGPY